MGVLFAIIGVVINFFILYAIVLTAVENVIIGEKFKKVVTEIVREVLEENEGMKFKK